MPKVTVPRRGITADDAAAVIRNALGDGLRVTPFGHGQVHVRRNVFIRANVRIAEDQGGGTTFTVRGSGPPTPVGMLLFMPVNNAGIAKRVAAAIEQHAGFRNGNG
jgi:hypothetical protein